MNIGLDIDEVLLRLLDAFILYHNQTYGTRVVKDDFRSYSFEEAVGGSKEEMKQKVLHFYTTPYFENIQPVPGSQQGIAKLAEPDRIIGSPNSPTERKNSLYVITARAARIKDQTKRSLAHHFPDRFSGLELTDQWFGTSTEKPRLKSSICVDKNIEVMVEDSLTQALDCAAAGIHVLLLDLGYGWNQTSEKLPENIKRAHSWEEIVAEIDSYGKKHGRG